MSDSTSLTASGDRTSSPVVGHSPPLARVAPITAMDSQFTSMELKLKARYPVKYFLKKSYLKIVL